ncbi:MAG: hypothetical protein ACP5VR_12915, partial [Acidimicrobiales bacterium]
EVVGHGAIVAIAPDQVVDLTRVLPGALQAADGRTPGVVQQALSWLFSCCFRGVVPSSQQRPGTETTGVPWLGAGCWHALRAGHGATRSHG